MLRLTELKLPLDHPESALRASVLARLGIPDSDLLGYSIARRGYDARRKSDIHLVYSLDVEVKNEAEVLRRLAHDKHLGPKPDDSYRPVAHAPQGLQERPVVIGTGPCGLLAGLLLAEMGFKPIILERGKAVRERTKDTFGLWRQACSIRNPTCNSAKAAPAPSPTASCTAASRTRASWAARC